MKFTINRASERFDSEDKQPCEEAKRETVTLFDEFGYASVEEYEAERTPGQKPWLDEGENHDISPRGNIRRE